MRDLLESLDQIDEAAWEWERITQDKRLMTMMDSAKRISDAGSTAAPLKIANIIFEAYKMGLEDGQSEHMDEALDPDSIYDFERDKETRQAYILARKVLRKRAGVGRGEGADWETTVDVARIYDLDPEWLNTFMYEK